MTITHTDFLDSMIALGAKTSEHDRAVRPFRYNTHIHIPPNFSAFDDVNQVADLAESEGIAVLGASNYYDYMVYLDFGSRLAERGIYPLFGLEVIALDPELQAQGRRINDPANPGKIYICGKSITRFGAPPPRARELLDGIRDRDSRRMSEMTAKIEAIFTAAGFATGLNANKIVDKVVSRHECPPESVCLQERHLVQAFQERLFELVPESARTEALGKILGVTPKSAPDDFVGIQGEIRSQLLKAGKPAYVPETFDTVANAHAMILELGGIPCYPVLADGVSPICELEATPRELGETLLGMGFHAAEFIPTRNSPEVLVEYVTTLRKMGLIVTAGTEHNTLDLIPIEPTCAKGVPIPQEAAEVFREGACIIAAHQHLGMKGEPGFVHLDGTLVSSDPDHLRRLRDLGATIIGA